MITDRDIAMCALFQGKPLREIGVQEAMSHSVSACHLDDAPDKVEQLMSERQIRRVPIVSAEGRLLGIVSLADLVREAGPHSTRAPSPITELEIRNTLAAICERPDSRRTTSGPSALATAWSE
jgi:CBS domain-containing protein